MIPPESLLGIPVWAVVYALSIVGFAISSWAAYSRVFRLIMLGRPSNRSDQPLRRIVGLIPTVFGQRKVLQTVVVPKDMAGLAHAMIFWGFLSFLFSYLVFIYGDSISPTFSSTILTETGVRIFAIYIDLLAGILLVVLAWAWFRRWVIKPTRLSFDITQNLDAILVVGFTAVLMLLTLATVALYVASGEEGPESSGYIGNFVGRFLETESGISESTASNLHTFTWFAHLIVILAFAVYIPFSKHTHLMGAPIAFFARRLQPSGTLATPENLEDATIFGAAVASDFTSRQLLDGFACAVCGRCTDSCPANISGKLLSPMHVVAGLRKHVTDVGSTVEKGDSWQGTSLIGGIVTEEALWDCVTCGACEQECPVGVEHLDTIVDMRRNLVMEQASMPGAAMDVLVNMEQRGHPWKGTTYSRTDWTEGLDVPTLADYPEAEFLLWVGCTPALEKGSQRIAQAMVSVMKRAEVDFAILGEEEKCTGDPARRIGNEYLYQTMARTNIELLERYNVKKVIALCPHCFNTIKNEYPHLGGNYRVQHYSEFVAELIDTGKIKPLVPVESTVAYHDSCYLGRHNGVYDPPRRIAESIPGLKLVEMENCRERGFCCGAGGGHMWMEENKGERINHVRTNQFLKTKADTVAVSCPFCLQMLDAGITDLGVKDEKKARDMLEILEESLG